MIMYNDNDTRLQWSLPNYFHGRPKLTELSMYEEC